jgi:hypothetical protein
VFEGDFADVHAFRHAMVSAEGQAVGADVPSYATGGAVMLDYSAADAGTARAD